MEVGVQLHVSFPDVRFSCVVAGNDERQFRRRKATRDGLGVGESVRTLEPEAGPRLKSTTMRNSKSFENQFRVSAVSQRFFGLALAP